MCPQSIKKVFGVLVPAILASLAASQGVNVEFIAEGGEPAAVDKIDIGCEETTNLIEIPDATLHKIRSANVVQVQAPCTMTVWCGDEIGQMISQDITTENADAICGNNEYFALSYVALCNCLGDNSPAAGFCDGNGASWNDQLWEDMGIDAWLQGRVEKYIDNGWPDDVSGVPRTIAEFGGEMGDDRDQVFNWGTQCTVADGLCDLGESALKGVDECRENGERAFSLWAMRNAARFVQGLYQTVTDVFDTSAFQVGRIVESFTDSVPEDLEMTTQGWLIIASGAAGAATAAIPLAAPAGGIVAGVLTVGVGILGGVGKDTSDPRFTTFADLQGRLGDLKAATQGGITQYFDVLFSTSPASGDEAAGNELKDLLAGGVWAGQDMSELSVSNQEMARHIQAGIITEAWNSQQVAIVKFGDGHLSEIGGSDGLTINPCFDAEGAGWDAPDMELYDACENDQNYVTFRFSDGGFPWSTKGFDQETLDRYGLTKKIVIDAAERRQAVSGVWLDRGLEAPQSQFAEWVENPPSNMVDLSLPFNLAVCDLNVINSSDISCDSPFALQCMAQIIWEFCPTISLGDEAFPYTKP